MIISNTHLPTPGHTRNIAGKMAQLDSKFEVINSYCLQRVKAIRKHKMILIVKMETTANKKSKFLMSDKTKGIILDVITYLYILLFFYAATSKLIAYEKSELQMSKSPIITDYAHILVWLVPGIEVIIGIFLVIPKTVLNGLYAALALMILFTAYIYSILNFSNYIPCSCGGVLQQLSWSEHLIFNTVFILLALVAIYLKISISKDKNI